MAGVRLKDRLIGFCDAATVKKCLLVFVIYVTIFAVARFVDMHLLPLDIAAVAFGLLAFSLLSRHLGALTPTIQWLGRHTMLVYVLQFPLMLLFSSVVRAWAGEALLGVTWLGAAYPVALTLLVVPSSLASGVMMQRVGLAGLFQLKRRSQGVPVPGPFPPSPLTITATTLQPTAASIS
jgi:uncharacterized membrane protein YcfT